MADAADDSEAAALSVGVGCADAVCEGCAVGDVDAHSASEDSVHATRTPAGQPEQGAHAVAPAPA